MKEVETLRSVIMSPDFKRELELMTEYGANIKLERPIVYCLAKFLHEKKHQVVLECPYDESYRRRKCDLVLCGRTIECKFHYDFDLNKVQRSLEKYDKKPDEIMKHKSVATEVLQDVLGKGNNIQSIPDIFIWVIMERNLTEKDRDLKNIAFLDDQVRFKEKGYYTGSRKTIVDDLEDLIQRRRPFISHNVESIGTTKYYSATFNFYLYEFNKE